MNNSPRKGSLNLNKNKTFKDNFSLSIKGMNSPNQLTMLLNQVEG